MRQSHFQGCQIQTRQPMTRTEEGHGKTNDLPSSHLQAVDDRDSSTCGSEYSENNSDDEGVFADATQLTVEDQKNFFPLTNGKSETQVHIVL